jgi:RimJ/RimL family protein N-acetyltransferase
MRLRPVLETDLDRLEEMFNDPDQIGVYNWGGFSDGTAWRKQWVDNRLLGADKRVLIIDLDGERIGFVSWHKVRTGQISYVHEFGISLWSEHRGKGHGTTAQRLLARYLFAHDPVNRIQAWTELDNIGEQRALEKAGFTREAVMREYSFRDGAWRDEVVYRMLRAELPAELPVGLPAGLPVDDEPDGEPAEDRG